MDLFVVLLLSLLSTGEVSAEYKLHSLLGMKARVTAEVRSITAPDIYVSLTAYKHF